MMSTSSPHLSHAISADKSPAASPRGTPAMVAQGSFQPRRSRPGNVLTHLVPNSQQFMAMPPSAVSTLSTTSGISGISGPITTSSVASSMQCSPTLSAEAPALTTGNSLQASPEPLRGRELADQFSSTFQLPESVLSQSLSHKGSTGSFIQPMVGGGSNVLLEPLNNNIGIFRRLSSRASKPFRQARRQSSTHGSARDASIGPSLARPRQRSNSDLTNPFTDSEDEAMIELDDKISLLNLGLECAGRDTSPTSAPSSLAGAGPQAVVAGPVVPLELRQGTKVTKISKRGARKQLTLVFDSHSAKITWDKNRTSKCIYIDDIKEIRTAEDIRQYRLDFNLRESDEPLFFTIIYTVPEKSRTKMMHILSPDAATTSSWVATLNAISMHRQDMMSSLMAFNDKAIRTYWKSELVKQLDAGSDGEETIDFPGVERVCRNLHIHVSSETLKSTFNEADTTGNSRLNFNEFQEFVRLMKRRDDIKAIYREVASDLEGGITLEAFLNFLSEVQCENVVEDRAHWESVFNRFARRSRTRDAKEADTRLDVEAVAAKDDGARMNEVALTSFLTSTYNVPIMSAPKEYTLDRPMNEYFISSSHNTYLLGRQVVGNSSVEGYISALMRGCRCVEVDCWDGSDGQPIVSHGWTLTTNISFREVINVINKYAFRHNEFPLWISLEVHCNPDQQRKMAAIMREVFGAKLVTEPLDPTSDKLPSPSELKNRILIKAKKPGTGLGASGGSMDEAKSSGESVGAPAGRRRGNSLTSPYSRPVMFDNTSAPSQSYSLPHSPLLTPSNGLPTNGRRGTRSRVSTITEGRVQKHDSPSLISSDCESGSEKEPGGSQSKIVKELGGLAVYCAGIKFQGFDDVECRTFNHVLSFHEGTFEKNSRPGEAKRALYRHNMRHMMRVYPHRQRLYSSNFDPLIVWRRGVQMAALNWQTFDLGLQLNQAMFDGGTDQSGYVLKPIEFREIQHFPYLPQHMVGGKRPRKNVNFSIDVISAQQLMRPHHFRDRQTVDPYVEVEAFLADDKRYKRGSDFSGPSIAKYKTCTVSRNGFNPVFDARFNFNFTTKYPDLVFVRWTVRLSEGGGQSDRNTILATFTAKLSSLKQGYRTLPLLDANGDRYLFSTLCCRLKVDPVTDVFVNYPEYEPDEGVNGKLRGIGRTVFSRSNTSPKSSVDGGQA